MTDPLYSLDNYNKEILEPMVKRFAEAQAAEELFKSNCLEDMIFAGYIPATRWQRFKYKIEDYKQRCKDIWTILKGDDIHKNCGY